MMEVSMINVVLIKFGVVGDQCVAFFVAAKAVLTGEEQRLEGARHEVTLRQY